jgi:hypothetical protein
VACTQGSWFSRVSGVDHLAYAKVVLEDRPVAYWPGFWRQGSLIPKPPWLPLSWWKRFLQGGLVEVVAGRNGRFVGTPPSHGRGIDAFGSVHFAAQPGQYVEVADVPLWSLPPANTGLTVEAWLRVDTLEFDDPQGAHVDFIHWLGKGIAGTHEWAFRVYSLTNHANRPNRLSFYVFNAAGGEGAGAHSEQGPDNPHKLEVGKWQHLVGTLTPFHGWPDPEHPHCRQEGASIFHDGQAVDGIAAGDANDSYWGFPDHAQGLLAQPVTFPLANATLELQAAAGFRPSSTMSVAVLDDAGHYHPVSYTGVTGASLTGCSGDEAGTASAGNPVRQGGWEITPKRGTAPLRFGTRDLKQYLPGSLCHIALYQHVLPPVRIALHHNAGHQALAHRSP